MGDAIRSKQTVTTGPAQVALVVAAMTLSACTSGHRDASLPSAARSAATSASTASDPAASDGSQHVASTPSTGAFPVPGGNAALASAVKHARRLLLARLILPPLPSFAIPTDLLTTAQDRSIAAALHAQPGLYQGIAVVGARCDATGSVHPADDKVAAVSGSRHYDDGTTDVTVARDGTGVYRSGSVSVSVLPRGAGVYDDGTTRVSVGTDGSGTYVSPMRRMTVRADGSGTYSDKDIRLWINRDGSAGYDDGRTHVTVSASAAVLSNGDKAAAEAAVDVLRTGLPRFAPVPRVNSIRSSGVSCGTLIRLDANVVFDFESAAVGVGGTRLVDRVARLLVSLGSPPALINGYTDHVGSSAFNQALSQRRAASVCHLLAVDGVRTAQLSLNGFGESHPLRAESNADGSDRPEVRQLDRRVEIVLVRADAARPTAAVRGSSCS